MQSCFGAENYKKVIYKKEFIGRTTDKSELRISQKNEWSDFLKPNRRYIITLREYEPGTSQAARGYYFNKIVPDFQKALYLQGTSVTKEETDLWLRENISPVTIKEEWDGEKWTKSVKSISELNNWELSFFIFEIKIFAAENMNFFIHDPRVI